MKGLNLLILLVLSVGFVSATVIVHNASLKENYFLNETISGTVNLTITNENLASNISSSSFEKVSLKDFLDFNGAAYTCEPLNCGKSYSSVSSGNSKTLKVVGSGDYYFGLVLTGNNVRLSDLDFDIKSDFKEEINNPLSIDFFEGKLKWKFNEFSNIFTAKYYGCYDETKASPGPLIRTSSYCELITLSESGKIEMGAIVDSSDNKNLRMNLYLGSGGGSLGSCTYNPSTKESCIVQADLGEVFSSGSYQVCVSADTPTDYKLYTEDVGSNCGFVKSSGPSNSTKDYGVFARVAKYKNATGFDSDEFNMVSLADYADKILESKYNRNCKNSCFLPIKINGANQNITLENLSAEITIDGEDNVYSSVHELVVSETKVGFSGILDFRLLGFKAKDSGNYKISLGSNVLVNQNIKITPSPLVNSVTPLNPPAGVPVKFIANVDFGGNKDTLTYVWTFGDGKTNTTKSNEIVYSYLNISNYTMKLKVSSRNLSSEKSFVITTISPKEAVNSTLKLRGKELDNFFNQTERLPSWYSKAILKESKYDFFRGELDRLTRAELNAFEEKDYIKIAQDLYSLDFPAFLFSEKNLGIGLVDDPEGVKPEVIASFAGGINSEFLEGYKQAIINWQGESVDSRISSDSFFIKKSSGVNEEILNVYDVYVTSKDNYGETYFVIDRDSSDVYANGETRLRDVESSTLVTINSGEEINFQFYTLNEQPINFFASPRLNSLVIEATIDTSCNFNNVCESGENSQTCRSDCKPTGAVILYLTLIVLFALVVYTLMQIWYDRRYEKHLFEDRRYLFNLLMYIANARARGKNYGEILKDLKEKGWSREQLHYAIAKSQGRRVGLPEIIPISKIMANKRNKMALQNQSNIDKSL